MIGFNSSEKVENALRKFLISHLNKKTKLKTRSHIIKNAFKADG